MTEYSYESIENTWLKLFWQIISENKSKIINKDYLGGLISTNKNITLERILANPDINWDWYKISKNPSIAIHTIESNPEVKLELEWYIKKRRFNYGFCIKKFR